MKKLDIIQICINILTIIISFILMGIPSIRLMFIVVNFISIMLLFDAVKEYKNVK